ncbi:hypothetical protein FA15DRAFT_584727 [Coprinopsis marcescibilis]|uniref:Uncharacterized protein n=1 Tax=Coprinopsis marcescibilis TaxID=230819 RepID=A0A5C3L8B8_COPMA|nr:hypothetical protein FA15DRAFT_584727 [Coprinopsis marcescibilis]
MLQKPIPLFLSSCFFALVSAQTPTHRNVSIDDQSPLIDYVPRTSWSLTDAGDWDAGEGRAHMVTNDADAYATFRFIGVAFYYYSALWPYRVGTGIRVDGGPVTVIDQQDHDSAPTAENQGPSVRAQVLSSVTGLSNSEHTIQILPPPGYGVAVVDFFM